MNKQSKIKLYNVLFIIFIVIFLFPIYKVYADTIKGSDGKEYTYSETDDGSDGADVTTIPFEASGYLKDKLETGYTASDFKVDTSNHGWRVYEENGNEYVVLAAASHNLINKYLKNPSNYNTTDNPFMLNFGRKFDHIHYFNMGDIVYFSFDDTEFDSKLYTGMILDISEKASFPQDKAWKKGNDINIIDIYFGSDSEEGESEDKKREEESKISGKKIYVSVNGIFSQNANVKTRNNNDLTLSLLTKVIILVGDWFESLIGSCFSNFPYMDPGVYTKDVVKGIDEFKLTEGEETTDAKFLRELDISNIKQNKSGSTEIIYSPDSGIPIIQHDVYSMVSQDLDLFDIDFITPDNPNENICWVLIRKFVASCTKIILYLSAAAFITILIWQGIRFVVSIYGDSPLRAAEAKEIMQNCAITIIRLIGIFIIITLTTNLYKYMKEQILGEFTSNYLIRVNIKGVYSFNTNTIGCIRLMTMSSNVYQAFVWGLIYLVAAIINLIYFGIMFFRMLAIGVFTIIAPITAITSVFETGNNVVSNNNILRFGGWFRIFMLIVWAPMLILIVSRLLFRI